jgi:hypothetical protein
MRGLQIRVMVWLRDLAWEVALGFDEAVDEILRGRS